jgi:hypothetical protein
MRNKIEKSKNKEDNHALYSVGERKEGKKKKQSPTTIQPPYAITRHTMRKRTR